MRRAIAKFFTFVVALGLGVGSIHAQNAQPPLPEIERRFDAALNAAEMAGCMKTMTAEPNHVGSAHNKANADMVLVAPVLENDGGF